MGKIFVPNGESAQDTAVLLLAEAENQGLPADAVGTTDGGFVVDEEIAKKSGAKYDKQASPDSSDAAARAQEARDQGESPEQAPSPGQTGDGNEDAEKKAAKKAAKKTTAKKTAKRAPAKKSAAKKTASKS